MEKVLVRNNPEDPNSYLVDLQGNDLWNLLEYHYEGKYYNYAAQKWERDTITEYIYTYDKETWIATINKGYAIYLYNKFQEYLDDESKSILEHDITGDPKLIEDFDYEGLRDYQIEAIQEIIKHRRGIIQNPTGSGKTEIIARMIINFLKSGKTVLVTVGLSKVIDEIKERIWKYSPDTYLPEYWDSNSQINLIYPAGFCRSYTFNTEDPFFPKVDVVLSDEVSGSTSESAWSVYGCITNPECCWYGFDATAEAELADRINIQKNLNCIHSTNTHWVISLFGMSWVFNKPEGYDIDLIEISSIGLREIGEGISDCISSETSMYRDVCNYIFSHKEYIRVVRYILEKYDKLFIPINNLEYINKMIDEFDSEYHILTLTGEGYWSNRDGWIDLNRFKELCEENKVQLVLTSSSGMKGLDFRGIPNVLLTLGVKASTVIQFVGRVARQKHFRVITITAGGKWKLPIYTRTNVQQIKLITNYYSDCNLQFIEEKYE